MFTWMTSDEPWNIPDVWLSALWISDHFNYHKSKQNFDPRDFNRDSWIVNVLL